MTRRRRRWPSSLRRRLVIGISAIVSVAMVGIGAVAVGTLRNEVDTVSDSQVSNSLAAFSYFYAKARSGLLGPDARSTIRTEPGSFAGQAPGTVIALLHNGTAVTSAVFTEGEPAPAPADVVRDLEALNWDTGGTRTVDLGTMGPHRVGSRDVGGGDRLVSAVSLTAANRALTRNTLIVCLLVLLALVLTALATVVLVRSALKPLRRVAAIAGQVAQLPLQADEYRITARVDKRDTDPDSEVGIVGLTLNSMLDNVDSALTRMASSDRHTRQFLSDASHELRTPLASILGYAELTRQESDVLPPMTEYALARIESESRRMSALVDDLLLLSRLEEGHDLEVERLDVCEIVTDAVNDAAVSAPDHHFAVELPEHPVWVNGDQARLHQVLANLLGNARVHTPAGVTVTTSVGSQGTGRDARVELVVSDDGPGIPEEIMPNLFGRFVRADKARSREMGCSGLGLAIVASIVEAHHGTVRAESRPGRTAFAIELPAAE